MEKSADHTPNDAELLELLTPLIQTISGEPFMFLPYIDPEKLAAAMRQEERTLPMPEPLHVPVVETMLNIPRIHVRFDLIMCLSSKEADRCGFVNAELPQVPNVGEIINLKGNPYIIHERRWTIDSKESGILYAYVRVIRAS